LSAQAGAARTRVVEFSSLADAETTTANDEDLVDVDKVAGTAYGAAVEVGLGIGRLLCLVEGCGDLCEGAQLAVGCARG
jgi:hypothetical protein